VSYNIGCKDKEKNDWLDIYMLKWFEIGADFIII